MTDLMIDNPAPSTPVVEALIAALPSGAVLLGNKIPIRNTCDASRLPAVWPAALVLPRSTEEVALAMRICHEFGQGVVVQGGMTGMAGGAIALANEVAISLERLSGIIEIDTECLTITAHAGTPLYQVQDAAANCGLSLGIDLGARGSCMVGGVVATNAGGHQVVRYGMTRQHVLGLEIVLPDGSIVSSLKKILKDNAGYSWQQLVIGSEGTLGIVTKAVFSLGPPTANIACALLSIDNTVDTVRLLRRLQAVLPAGLLAFEAMWSEFQDAATRHTGVNFPFAEPRDVAVLIDVAAEGVVDLEMVLGEIYEEGLIKDALLAKSEAERQTFWHLRESLYEFSKKMPPGPVFDISIPLNQLDNAVLHFRDRLPKIGEDIEWALFGHLGDSNLHIRLGSSLNAAEVASQAKACIYEIVAELNGSVSAEHGIGTLKRDVLGYTRSETEIALMRTIKQAIDPQGILNRDRVFVV